MQNNPVMRQDPTGMLDLGPGGPGEADPDPTKSREILYIDVVKNPDGTSRFIPIYANSTAPTVDAAKKSFNRFEGVSPRLKLHDVADGGTMSQTRETWADNWRSSEPITYGLMNDAYVGLQGLPFFGDLLKRGGSPNASNLDGTISQDPIGSFINTASMFFGGSAGNALVKRIGGRVFRWFNKFVPWKAAKTSSRLLSWGNNAKGHLIKHADVLGFGGHTPQQLQKMLPQLRSAANLLYNNVNPALTRIGRWGGQTDDVLMHITNNGKMLVTKQNGVFITVINKTSNNWYQLAKPLR